MDDLHQHHSDFSPATLYDPLDLTSTQHIIGLDFFGESRDCFALLGAKHPCKIPAIEALFVKVD